VKIFPRLFIALFIAIGLDGLTKFWIIQTLAPYRPMPVIGQFFRLTLGYNDGVAFSLLANMGEWSVVITVIIGIIILALALWLVNAMHKGELLPQAGWSVGLVLGGASANFANRLLDGRVIDFIDIGLGAWRWPAFNLADSCIVAGMAWLVWIKMRDEAMNNEAMNNEQ